MKFFTKNYCQHRLNFRDHRRKTCYQTNTTCEDRGGGGGEHAGASERTRLTEEAILFESRPKVRKVVLDDVSDFECYNRSERKPVHVDFDKEMAESYKPTLALLPNRSEEDEINHNGETQDKEGNTKLRSSNRIFTPPERLGSVPYF